MVNLGKRIQYSHVFDNDPEKIDELYKQLERTTALRCASTLLNATINNNFKYKGTELFGKWFSVENKQIKNKLIALDASNGKLLNLQSSLSIYENVIKRDDFLGTADRLEVQIILLKIYLIHNSEQEARDKINGDLLTDKGKIDPEEAQIGFMLGTSIVDHDLTNYDPLIVLSSQVYKITKFFQFLELNKLDEHLQLFLVDFGVKSWNEWLKNYYAFLLPIMSKKNTGTFFDLTVDEDTEGSEVYIKFIEMLCIDGFSDEMEKDDYIALRSKPLIKIEKGRYQLTNEVFALDSIYKSVIFKFSLVINENVSKENKITNFRSEFCNNFSENFLLYQLMKDVFPKKWKTLAGSYFKVKKMDSEPDFYARLKNKLLLFESKDVVLPGRVKATGNYLDVRFALEKKFRFEQKEKKGKIKIVNRSIRQLLVCTKDLYNGKYEVLDDQINYDFVKIYPIIIVHDRQFDSLGLNKLIELWYREDLDEYEFDKRKVRRPVILNIDCLIAFQDLFKNDTLKLEQIIDSYWLYVDSHFKKARFFEELVKLRTDTFISFSDFLSDKVQKQGRWKLPHFMMKYAALAFK